jgi:uncharacterized protein (UPF0128 family)
MMPWRNSERYSDFDYDAALKESDLDRQIAEAEREVVEAARLLNECSMECGYGYFSCDREWRDEKKALRVAVDALEELLKRRGEME